MAFDLNAVEIEHLKAEMKIITVEQLQNNTGLIWSHANYCSVCAGIIRKLEAL